jgi:hypothetical protein
VSLARGRAAISESVTSLTRICPGFKPPSPRAVSQSRQRAMKLWANAGKKVIEKIRLDKGKRARRCPCGGAATCTPTPPPRATLWVALLSQESRHRAPN